MLINNKSDSLDLLLSYHNHLPRNTVVFQSLEHLKETKSFSINGKSVKWGPGRVELLVRLVQTPK